MTGISNIIMLPFKIHQKHPWVLLALIMTFGPLPRDAMAQDENDFEGILKLKTDAPAVLDAPITITATLQNSEHFHPPFYFSFSKSNTYIRWVLITYY